MKRADITRTAVPARSAPPGAPVKTPQPIGPSPLWLQRCQEQLGSWAKGYVLGVSHIDPQSLTAPVKYFHARGVARGRVGQLPEVNWTQTTRCNLASVSKTITAVAAIKLLWSDTTDWLSEKFWGTYFSKLPIFQNNYPLGNLVDQVTIKQLLTQTSGLASNGDLEFKNHDIWAFLYDYLQKPASGSNKYAYNNANFTILQGVIGQRAKEIDPVKYPSYEAYVRHEVLEPMGIDTSVFSAKPDSLEQATLAYQDATDARDGYYIEHIDGIAAGGWIASAEQLLQFMIALRGESVLTNRMKNIMFGEQLGCYHYPAPYDYPQGYGSEPYIWHNGALSYLYRADSDKAGAVPNEIHTGVARLADGWDAVLLINSADGTSWPDPVSLIFDAFDAGTRGELVPVYRYENASAAASHYYTVEQAPPPNSTWTFQGVQFYTPKPSRPKTAISEAVYRPGAPPLYRYQAFVVYQFYRLNAVNYNPNTGWTWSPDGEPFCAFQPMGDVALPWLSELRQFELKVGPDIRFYTSDPAQEVILDGSWQDAGYIGYVYNAVATPVFQYSLVFEGATVLYYTTYPAGESLYGWTNDGIMFYALAAPLKGVVPLIRYYNTKTPQYHWFSQGQVGPPPNTSDWTKEQTTYIYLWSTQIAGSEPLFAYQYNYDDRIQFLTSQQDQRPTRGWQELGVAGYVYNPKWRR